MGKATFGNVRKLPSGNWQARFRLPGTGQFIKAPHTFATKGAATSWLATQKHLIDHDQWQPNDTKPKTAEHSETFDYYAELHKARLESMAGAHDNSKVSIESAINARLLPTFGGVKVKLITPQMVEDWFTTLREDLSISTVRDRYGLLKRILNIAVEKGDITENPCKLKIVKPKSKGSLSDEQVASPEEVKAFALNMPERLRLAVFLAAWCQARQGEILGLRRASLTGLDTKTPELVIDRQWVAKTSRFGPTKNEANRSVSIPLELVPMIVAHLGKFVGVEPDSALFPAEPKGVRPMSNNSMRNAWNRARQVVGREGFKFHDLRHTGLTFFARQGATLAELMHRGGHKDVEVALRYQHWSVERDRELTARMGGLVGESLPD